MPSINDALKEKFGVSGSNIAETISKVEGIGGSFGSGWLLVNLKIIFEDESIERYELDHTAGEIKQAFPFVMVRTYEEYDSSEYLTSVTLGGISCLDLTNPERLEFLITSPNNETLVLTSESLTDYPRAVR